MSRQEKRGPDVPGAGAGDHVQRVQAAGVGERRCPLVGVGVGQLADAPQLGQGHVALTHGALAACSGACSTAGSVASPLAAQLSAPRPVLLVVDREALGALGEEGRHALAGDRPLLGGRPRPGHLQRGVLHVHLGQRLVLARVQRRGLGRLAAAAAASARPRSPTSCPGARDTCVPRGSSRLGRPGPAGRRTRARSWRRCETGWWAAGSRTGRARVRLAPAGAGPAAPSRCRERWRWPARPDAGRAPARRNARPPPRSAASRWKPRSRRSDRSRGRRRSSRRSVGGRPAVARSCPARAGSPPGRGRARRRRGSLGAEGGHERGEGCQAAAAQRWSPCSISSFSCSASTLRSAESSALIERATARDARR